MLQSTPRDSGSFTAPFLSLRPLGWIARLDCSPGLLAWIARLDCSADARSVYLSAAQIASANCDGRGVAELRSCPGPAAACCLSSTSAAPQQHLSSTPAAPQQRLSLTPTLAACYMC